MASGTGSQVMVTRPFPDFAATFAGGGGSSSSAAIESPAPHSPSIPSMVICVRLHRNISSSSQALIIWWCLLLLQPPGLRKQGVFQGLRIGFLSLTKRRKESQRGSGNGTRVVQCSRNTHDKNVLVRRAQWKINQPPFLKRKRVHLERSLRWIKDRDNASLTISNYSLPSTPL